MPKRSDVSCKRSCIVKGYRYDGYLEILDGIKYYRFIVGNEESQIPVELIDKLKENEWVYDCGNVSNRKKVK